MFMGFYTGRAFDMRDFNAMGSYIDWMFFVHGPGRPVKLYDFLP